jgi:cell division initiation protein
MSQEATAAPATIPPMPDQSSAASEHAIIQEITGPLETLPDDPLAVVNADFPVALRGYDRIAVDAYVQQTSQLVAELQATRSPEAAVRRALERVGEQIAGILQRAHETAEEITAQSRREAEDRLEKARIEAAEILAGAQRRVSDLDVETDRIWAERHRIIDDARELAQQLLALAEPAAERFPPAETTPYDDDVTTTRAPIITSQAAAPEDSVAEGADYEEAHSEEGEGVYVRYQDEHERLDHEQEPLGEQEPLDEQETDAEASKPDASASGSEAEANDPEDLDETVPFKPLKADEIYQDPEGVADPPEPPAPPRPSSSKIPPASEAANRRTSK